MRMKADPEKHCERCGVQLTRQRFGARLEDRSVFLRRRFCSLTCANSRTVLTKGAYHWRARQHRKSACEACGRTTALHVHHSDGDPSNNDPANLQTLCTHCHGFWHKTLARLGLPIGGRMPPLFGTRGDRPLRTASRA
jgi:hypothetical protein